MGWLRRARDRARQSDEERLTDEIRDWARTVPGTHPLGSCPSREPVKVSGVVQRITLRPRDGATTLEAVITDGTGQMTAAWTGRERIEGLHLGTRLVLAGVVGATRHGQPRMVNPDFEFA